MAPLFNKVIIIGVGQIGASIGMNLVSQKLAVEVIGMGRDRKNLREAIRRKAIHQTVRISLVRPQFSAPSLLGDGDLIILATPVQTIRELLKKMPKEPLIIDVGSTKLSILKEAERRHLRFIGCHPIAGTEKGGASGADRYLFQNKACLVAPSRRISIKDLSNVISLWKKMGSQTVVLEAKKQDQLLGLFSHLPHVLAFTFMNMASKGENLSWIKKLWPGLGSFRSATRVIGSPVSMVNDLLMENRDFVCQSIDQYLTELKKFRSLLTSRNKQKLERYLSQVQQRYRGVS